MASALLIPAAPSLVVAWSSYKFRAAAIAAFIGAVLPDASLFLMFAIAKAQGVSEQVIFSEWYYSEFWQGLGAMTNSIPIYALVALTAYILQKSTNQNSVGVRRWYEVISIVGLAAFIHTLTDLPLHHDDGHPHFWPFSHWVYASPISYWDPNHYGAEWSLVELVLAAVFIVLLWRRYANRLARVGLLLAAISYAAMSLFWLNAFG